MTLPHELESVNEEDREDREAGAGARRGGGLKGKTLKMEG